MYIAIKPRMQFDRENRQKLPCFYCGCTVHSIRQHLQRRHHEETEVERILTNLKILKNFKIFNTKSSSEYIQDLTKLVNIGTFSHNVRVLNSGTGDFMVTKLSGKYSTMSCSYDDFLPCSFCYGFFLAKKISSHGMKCKLSNRECKLSGKKKHFGFDANARCLLTGATTNIDDFVDLTGFGNKISSELFKLIQNDKLILLFWCYLMANSKRSTSCDIRKKLMQLAVLKQELTALCSEPVQLTDLIATACFDKIVKSVKLLLRRREFTGGKIAFEKPSLGFEIGTLLVKCAHLKIGMAMREGNTPMRLKAEEFLRLYRSRWADLISSLTALQLKKRVMNSARSPDILPLTADLLHLAVYQRRQINEQEKLLGLSQTWENWHHLSELVLSRLALFNWRAGVEKLTLSAYKKHFGRDSVKQIHTRGILSHPLPLEKELIKRSVYFDYIHVLMLKIFSANKYL